ncbi:unnamed protein product [Symbiodinium necroappetens]|uniref:Pentatricopeptide repeat-containing protein, chloroplastic n=1 Tax=Symbiodinium necroappetens TaxID=1628268 RepID=A0A812UCP6_9DINO|nr:unnamed protein product [Symbiodinium necroappetens]
MLFAGVRPGGHAFNPVVCAWAGAGSPRRAEAWLWKAMEGGLKPSKAALEKTLAAYASADGEGLDRMKRLMTSLGSWPKAWATAIISKPYAAAGDFGSVEQMLEELQAAGEAPDASCFKVLLMAYARGPRTLDARVEVCLERLWALKTLWTKQEEAEVLGDARRALGKERYDQLARKLGLRTPPRITGERHSRARVVGTWHEIHPAE